MFLKNSFPQVSDSLLLFLYSLHVHLLRASIKINQSIVGKKQLSANPLIHVMITRV